jgi:hypothetical protein
VPKLNEHFRSSFCTLFVFLLHRLVLKCISSKACSLEYGLSAFVGHDEYANAYGNFRGLSSFHSLAELDGRCVASQEKIAGCAAFNRTGRTRGN